jgi:hypothetical protein
MILVAHQQHMLVVAVEENSDQIQEMLVLVDPVVAELAVKRIMVLMEHKPLVVVAVVEEW